MNGKLIVTLTIGYKLNDETLDGMEAEVRSAIDAVAGMGGLSGYTSAEMTTWNVDVEQVESEEDDGNGAYECQECGSTYHPTSECPNKEVGA